MARKILIGTVGVDTAQLYIGEPCYLIGEPLGKMEWGAFMHMLQPEEAQWWTVNGTQGKVTFPAGMVVKTGYGDGEYPVHITRTKDGEVASVTITFIRE